MNAFVYLLECADGTVYTGWSNDPEKRAAAHNAGRGAKYTRSRRPVRLAYVQECADKSTALKREAELKKMSHAEKITLIEQYTQESGKQYVR